MTEAYFFELCRFSIKAKENIRVTRIFLSDQQTAGVTRSKITKNKTIAKNVAVVAYFSILPSKYFFGDKYVKTFY
ncbi:MAG: hypothetical protein LBU89_12830 [Fibromonadaceae bacterium]|nr:hypothetical protein [Fibromonadaceae bacterium]